VLSERRHEYIYQLANDCSDQLNNEELVHLSFGINDVVRKELCGKGGLWDAMQMDSFANPKKRSEESEKGIDHSAVPRLLPSQSLDSFIVGRIKQLTEFVKITRSSYAFTTQIIKT
jgi:hypothetical protein